MVYFSVENMIGQNSKGVKTNDNRWFFFSFLHNYWLDSFNHCVNRQFFNNQGVIFPKIFGFLNNIGYLINWRALKCP